MHVITEQQQQPHLRSFIVTSPEGSSPIDNAKLDGLPTFGHEVVMVATAITIEEIPPWLSGTGKEQRIKVSVAYRPKPQPIAIPEA